MKKKSLSLEPITLDILKHATTQNGGVLLLIKGVPITAMSLIQFQIGKTRYNQNLGSSKTNEIQDGNR